MRIKIRFHFRGYETGSKFGAFYQNGQKVLLLSNFYILPVCLIIPIDMLS